MSWARIAAEGIVTNGDALVGWAAGLAVGAQVIGDNAVTAATDDVHLTGAYEIGSIAKTMTATLIATAVLDGHLGLDDQIGGWIDAGQNADITVRELATHTAGLPRLAPNAFDHEGYDSEDPYAVYTEDLAEAGLRATTLASRGEGAYSNFGFQLLGMVLERSTGRSYADLLRVELAEPLGAGGLRRISADPRLPGFSKGEARRNWSLPLPGPGGVVATIADMVAYGAAVLAPPTERLTAAIEMATGGAGATGPALGWARSGPTTLWHNGGTYGFHSMLAVDRDSQRVLVVLVADGDADLDATVIRVLQGADPADLAAPPSVDDALVPTIAPHLDRFAVGDWPALVAGSSQSFGERLERNGRLWQQLVDRHGPAGAWRAVNTRAQGSATIADALVVFGTTDVPVEVTVVDGVLVGMSIKPA